MSQSKTRNVPGRWIPAVLAALAVAVSCAPPPSSRFSAYPVYAAVLESFVSGRDTLPLPKVYVRVSTVDLVAEARGGLDVRRYARELKVPLSVFRDFNVANVIPGQLADSIRAPLPIDFYPPRQGLREDEDIRHVLKVGAWKRAPTSSA